MHGHAAADPDAEAPILRSGPRSSCGEPDAAAPGHPRGGDAELGAGVDQRLLDPADVVDDEHVVGQPHDRVADQLARAVEGDLAAAVDVDAPARRRRAAARAGSVRLPAVKTGGCSSSSTVPGPPATTPACTSRWRSQAATYSTASSPKPTRRGRRRSATATSLRPASGAAATCGWRAVRQGCRTPGVRSSRWPVPHRGDPPMSHPAGPPTTSSSAGAASRLGAAARRGAAVAVRGRPAGLLRGHGSPRCRRTTTPRSCRRAPSRRRCSRSSRSSPAASRCPPRSSSSATAG